MCKLCVEILPSSTTSCTVYKARQTQHRNAVCNIEEHPTGSHGLTRCDWEVLGPGKQRIKASN
eukprot:4235807-Karenia_brevis.AAC.1